jgi:hypothetical protein
MKVYSVINTMNQIGGDSIGTIVSNHRTLEAAQKSEGLFQRSVKRANGANSYVPTRIVIIPQALPTGVHVSPGMTRSMEGEL